ncbi:hypothetical protein GCM10007342_22410 [Staphylococcus pragensis]|nr:hypothetical protein GCM10007342_22410 [Staphylococcus pragensis]
MSVETKAQPSPLGKHLNLSEMIIHLRTTLETAPLESETT